MIGGIGTVNGDRFEGRDARVIAVSYDYTVLAGTQGHRNHRKKDRLFELAERLELPVAGVFEVNEQDQISLWRDYFDMATYARQLQALTAADAPEEPPA